MAVYHPVMEAYNITEKNASDKLQIKLKTHEGKHSERCAAKNDLFVPEKPRPKCIGFSYIGPKLFNMLVLLKETGSSCFCHNSANKT